MHQYVSHDPAHKAVGLLLVDDQEMFRGLARETLTSDGTFAVVAEADCGREAIDKAGRLHPDVVVMDVQMDDMTGLEATRHILALQPKATVVLTSINAERGYPLLAREIGAVGFIPKRHLNARSLRYTLGLSDRAAPPLAA